MKHVGGGNTPDQTSRMEEKHLETKNGSSPDAHWQSQAQVVAFIGIREAEEAGKRKKENAKEQMERAKRHRECAIKRRYGVEIKMHPIHPQWCKSEKEHKYTRGVQSFLSKMRWKSEEAKEGGITWIELYALYSIHGGSGEEEARKKLDPLNTPPMLQGQIAEFKKAVRKAKKFTISLEQEWHFERCQIMRNRLSDAAIDNRQAAVKGMPIISQKDAQGIMRTLLALRGADSKRNIDAWEQGKLTVMQGSLKLQGVAQKWRSRVEQSEVWISEKQFAEETIRELEPDASESTREAELEMMSIDASKADGGGNTPVGQPLQMGEIRCCRCYTTRKLGNTKLFTNTGFSSIKCPSKHCGTAVISDKWFCRCLIRWAKCPRHVHIASAGKIKENSPAKNKMIKHLAKYGTTKARPKVMPKIIKKTRGGNTPGARSVSKTIPTTSELSSYESPYYYGAMFQSRLLRLQAINAARKPIDHVKADAPT